ncbi:MAG TPA: tannase/feruloyl esterase family alpha/beta hydrolase [Vicinamibacterales bacterium]|jgi:feruloyl esterase|nr:tannase/feruloyl esterase family alpha/beta hydrolase [Vicinamibacterales bacterium]
MLTVYALMLAGSLAVDAGPCEGLKTLSLPNTSITTAELVPAGPFTPPGRGGGAGRGRGAAVPGRAAGRAPATGAGQPPNVPANAQAQAGVMLGAYCRVEATLKPSPDSDIKIEVWLPAENWNGKFEAVGNGGWAGVISYPAMATALQEGYATASTDTGHVGGTATFAIDHPEKLTDFAYRAVHEMTVQAKALINKYYGRAPRLSYWNGCSTGGRQGLMEAQKYPDDFDAILAGAPANYQTHLHTWDLSVSAPVLRDPAEAVPAAKLRMVSDAAIAACDAKDGVKDGLIGNPRACAFDVATLQCKAAETDSCLTGAQVTAMKRVYQPAKTASGQYVFPGKEPGSEYQWAAYIGGQQAPGVSVGSFQVAYGQANWDPRSFDLDRDLKVVDEKVGPVNAINPDLRAFKQRGGKLLLYHGWNDTAISPGNTIDYYQSVLTKMGGKQDDFVRLFMVPAMQHCGGGPGPNQINWFAALERWREASQAPARIDAARVSGTRVDMTRPLCPYPQVAVYSGTGSTNDAGSFSCKAP